MIKNRNIQILFQTVYCTLGIVGLFSSFGLFNAKFNADVYVYYTNLSNYICIGFMLASLVFTMRSANAKEDGPCTLAPAFKFMSMIMILVTFLVYNILLAKDNSAADYFTSVNNLIMHLILPLMFVADWILFYEHGLTKWYYPLLSLIMPLVYVVFVIIRAAIVNHETASVVYPYFFLNADELGWGGLVLWVFILVLIFVVIGYIIYALDNIKLIKTKLTEWKNKRAGN